MNYDQYYNLCKKSYTGDIDTEAVANFYTSPVRIYDPNFLGNEYLDIIKNLADLITQDFNTKNRL